MWLYYFGKGNYAIVDTSGGYHILVKTSAIKANPHDFCKAVQSIYKFCIDSGAEPYLDDKGNCKSHAKCCISLFGNAKEGADSEESAENVVVDQYGG